MWLVIKFPMATELDNSLIPGRKKAPNSDLLGWISDKTCNITTEVRVHLEKLIDRKYRSEGINHTKSKSFETVPVFKKLQDHHSKLTSDDLLWYIRQMNEIELRELKNIKIKWEDMIIPRELSREIIKEIERMDK